MNPRRKPKFLRHGAKARKAVGMKWRRPRGRHTKMKIYKKGKGHMPKVGYGAPKNLRWLHPSGFREVLIQNLNDLNKIDNKKEAGRISHRIGKKKRQMILEKAKELNIKILNP